MNERIFTELYKKAWGHFPCPTGEPELEKFAELIVRECANEILKWKSEPFPYDPEFGAKLIKEHFGIEK